MNSIKIIISVMLMMAVTSVIANNYSTIPMYRDHGSAYLWVNTNITRETVKLVLDTGCPFSMISKSALKRGIKGGRDVMAISGFGGTGKSVNTHGSTSFSITTVNGKVLDTTVHIVDKSCIPHDGAHGYLGLDFMRKYEMMMVFHTDTLVYHF